MTRPFLALGLAVALAGFLSGCQKQNQGANPMRKTLEQSLREIPVSDDQKLAALADTLRKQGLDPTREIVGWMASGDKDMADKALVVTLNLGAFALPPLLAGLDPNYPVDCAQLLQHAVDFEFQQRHQVAKALEKLLGDKRPVPQPRQAKSVEEKFRSRRLCDVAYLQLRRLLSLDENIEAVAINERMFLDMEESQRDAEIAKVRESKRFTNLLEYFPGE